MVSVSGHVLLSQKRVPANKLAGGASVLGKRTHEEVSTDPGIPVSLPQPIQQERPHVRPVLSHRPSQLQTIKMKSVSCHIKSAPMIQDGDDDDDDVAEGLGGGHS